MRYHIIYSVFCMMMHVARGSWQVLPEVAGAAKRQSVHADSSGKYVGESVNSIQARVSRTPETRFSRYLLSISPRCSEQSSERPKWQFVQGRSSSEDDTKKEDIVRNETSVPEANKLMNYSEEAVKPGEMLSPSKILYSGNKRAVESEEKVSRSISRSDEPVWQVQGSPSLSSGSNSAKSPSLPEHSRPSDDQRQDYKEAKRHPDQSQLKGDQFFQGVPDNVAQSYPSNKVHNPSNENFIASRVHSGSNPQGPYTLDSYIPDERVNFKRGFQLLPVPRNLYILKEDTGENRERSVDDENQFIVLPRESAPILKDNFEKGSGDRTSAVLSFKAHMHHDVKDIGNNFRRKVSAKNLRFANFDDSPLEMQDSLITASSTPSIIGQSPYSAPYLQENSQNLSQEPSIRSPGENYRKVADPLSNSLNNGPVLDNINMYAGNNNIYDPNPQSQPFWLAKSYQDPNRDSANNFQDNQVPFNSYQSASVYQPVQESPSMEKVGNGEPGDSDWNVFEENPIDSAAYQPYRLKYLDRYAKALSSMNDDNDSNDLAPNTSDIESQENILDNTLSQESLLDIENDLTNQNEDSVNPRDISFSKDDQMEVDLASSNEGGKEIRNWDTNVYEDPNPSYLPMKLLDSSENSMISSSIPSTIGEGHVSMADVQQIEPKGKSFSTVVEPLTAQLQKLLSTIKLLNENLTNELNSEQHDSVELRNKRAATSMEKTGRKKHQKRLVDDIVEEVDPCENDRAFLRTVDEGANSDKKIRNETFHGLPENSRDSQNNSGPIVEKVSVTEFDRDDNTKLKRNPGIMDFFEKTFSFGQKDNKSTTKTTVSLFETMSIEPIETETLEVVTEETNIWTTTQEEYSSGDQGSMRDLGSSTISSAMINIEPSKEIVQDRGRTTETFRNTMVLSNKSEENLTSGTTITIQKPDYSNTAETEEMDDWQATLGRSEENLKVTTVLPAKDDDSTKRETNCSWITDKIARFKEGEKINSFLESILNRNANKISFPVVNNKSKITFQPKTTTKRRPSPGDNLGHLIIEQDHTMNLQDPTMNLQDRTMNLQDRRMNLQDRTMNLQDHTMNLQDHNKLQSSTSSNRENIGHKLETPTSSLAINNDRIIFKSQPRQRILDTTRLYPIISNTAGNLTSKSRTNENAVVTVSSDDRGGNARVNIRLKIPIHNPQNHQKIISRDTDVPNTKKYRNIEKKSRLRRENLAYENCPEAEDYEAYFDLGNYDSDSWEDSDLQDLQSSNAGEDYDPYLENLNEDNHEPAEPDDLTYEFRYGQNTIAAGDENSNAKKKQETSKINHHIWPEHVDKKNLLDVDAIQSSGDSSSPLYQPDKSSHDHQSGQENRGNGQNEATHSHQKSATEPKSSPKDKKKKHKGNLSNIDKADYARFGRKLQSISDHQNKKAFGGLVDRRWNRVDVDDPTFLEDDLAGPFVFTPFQDMAADSYNPSEDFLGDPISIQTTELTTKDELQEATAYYNILNMFYRTTDVDRKEEIGVTSGHAEYEMMDVSDHTDEQSLGTSLETIMATESEEVEAYTDILIENSKSMPITTKMLENSVFDEKLAETETVEDLTSEFDITSKVTGSDASTMTENVLTVEKLMTISTTASIAAHTSKETLGLTDLKSTSEEITSTSSSVDEATEEMTRYSEFVGESSTSRTSSALTDLVSTSDRTESSEAATVALIVTEEDLTLEKISAATEKIIKGIADSEKPGTVNEEMETSTTNHEDTVRTSTVAAEISITQISEEITSGILGNQNEKTRFDGNDETPKSTVFIPSTIAEILLKNIPEVISSTEFTIKENTVPSTVTDSTITTIVATATTAEIVSNLAQETQITDQDVEETSSYSEYQETSILENTEHTSSRQISTSAASSLTETTTISADIIAVENSSENSDVIDETDMGDGAASQGTSTAVEKTEETDSETESSDTSHKTSTEAIMRGTSELEIPKAEATAHTTNKIIGLNQVATEQTATKTSTFQITDSIVTKYVSKTTNVTRGEKGMTEDTIDKEKEAMEITTKIKSSTKMPFQSAQTRLTTRETLTSPESIKTLPPEISRTPSTMITPFNTSVPKNSATIVRNDKKTSSTHVSTTLQSKSTRTELMTNETEETSTKNPTIVTITAPKTEETVSDALLATTKIQPAVTTEGLSKFTEKVKVTKMATSLETESTLLVTTVPAKYSTDVLMASAISVIEGATDLTKMRTAFTSSMKITSTETLNSSYTESAESETADTSSTEAKELITTDLSSTEDKEVVIAEQSADSKSTTYITEERINISKLGEETADMRMTTMEITRKMESDTKKPSKTTLSVKEVMTNPQFTEILTSEVLPSSSTPIVPVTVTPVETFTSSAPIVTEEQRTSSSHFSTSARLKAPMTGTAKTKTGEMSTNTPSIVTGTGPGTTETVADGLMVTAKIQQANTAISFTRFSENIEATTVPTSKGMEETLIVTTVPETFSADSFTDYTDSTVSESAETNTAKASKMEMQGSSSAKATEFESTETNSVQTIEMENVNTSYAEATESETAEVNAGEITKLEITTMNSTKSTDLQSSAMNFTKTPTLSSFEASSVEPSKLKIAETSSGELTKLETAEITSKETSESLLETTKMNSAEETKSDTVNTSSKETTETEFAKMSYARISATENTETLQSSSDGTMITEIGTPELLSVDLNTVGLTVEMKMTETMKESTETIIYTTDLKESEDMENEKITDRIDVSSTTETTMMAIEENEETAKVDKETAGITDKPSTNDIQKEILSTSTEKVASETSSTVLPITETKTSDTPKKMSITERQSELTAETSPVLIISSTIITTEPTKESSVEMYPMITSEVETISTEPSKIKDSTAEEKSLGSIFKVFTTETTPVSSVIILSAISASTESIESSTSEKFTEIESSTSETSTEIESSTSETSTEIESSTSETSTEIESSTSEKSTEIESSTSETSTEIKSSTSEKSSEIEPSTSETSTEIKSSTSETSTEIESSTSETSTAIESSTSETFTEIESSTSETSTEIESSTSETSAEIESSTSETSTEIESSTSEISTEITLAAPDISTMSTTPGSLIAASPSSRGLVKEEMLDILEPSTIMETSIVTQVATTYEDSNTTGVPSPNGVSSTVEVLITTEIPSTLGLTIKMENIEATMEGTEIIESRIETTVEEKDEVIEGINEVTTQLDEESLQNIEKLSEEIIEQGTNTEMLSTITEKETSETSSLPDTIKTVEITETTKSTKLSNTVSKTSENLMETLIKETEPKLMVETSPASFASSTLIIPQSTIASRKEMYPVDAEGIITISSERPEITALITEDSNLEIISKDTTTEVIEAMDLTSSIREAYEVITSGSPETYVKSVPGTLTAAQELKTESLSIFGIKPIVTTTEGRASEIPMSSITEINIEAQLAELISSPGLITEENSGFMDIIPIPSTAEVSSTLEFPSTLEITSTSEISTGSSGVRTEIEAQSTIEDINITNILSKTETTTISPVSDFTTESTDAISTIKVSHETQEKSPTENVTISETSETTMEQSTASMTTEEMVRTFSEESTKIEAASSTEEILEITTPLLFGTTMSLGTPKTTLKITSTASSTEDYEPPKTFTEQTSILMTASTSTTKLQNNRQETTESDLETELALLTATQADGKTEIETTTATDETLSVETEEVSEESDEEDEGDYEEEEEKDSTDGWSDYEEETIESPEENTAKTARIFIAQSTEELHDNGRTTPVPTADKTSPKITETIVEFMKITASIVPTKTITESTSNLPQTIKGETSSTRELQGSTLPSNATSQQAKHDEITKPDIMVEITDGTTAAVSIDTSNGYFGSSSEVKESGTAEATTVIEDYKDYRETSTIRESVKFSTAMSSESSISYSDVSPIAASEVSRSTEKTVPGSEVPVSKIALLSSTTIEESAAPEMVQWTSSIVSTIEVFSETELTSSETSSETSSIVSTIEVVSDAELTSSETSSVQEDINTSSSTFFGTTQTGTMSSTSISSAKTDAGAAFTTSETSLEELEERFTGLTPTSSTETEKTVPGSEEPVSKIALLSSTILEESTAPETVQLTSSIVSTIEVFSETELTSSETSSETSSIVSRIEVVSDAELTSSETSSVQEDIKTSTSTFFGTTQTGTMSSTSISSAKTDTGAAFTTSEASLEEPFTGLTPTSSTETEKTGPGSEVLVSKIALPSSTIPEKSTAPETVQLTSSIVSTIEVFSETELTSSETSSETSSIVSTIEVVSDAELTSSETSSVQEDIKTSTSTFFGTTQTGTMSSTSISSAKTDTGAAFTTSEASLEEPFTGLTPTSSTETEKTGPGSEVLVSKIALPSSTIPEKSTAPETVQLTSSIVSTIEVFSETELTSSETSSETSSIVSTIEVVSDAELTSSETSSVQEDIKTSTSTFFGTTQTGTMSSTSISSAKTDTGAAFTTSETSLDESFIVLTPTSSTATTLSSTEILEIPSLMSEMLSSEVIGFPSGKSSSETVMTSGREILSSIYEEISTSISQLPSFFSGTQTSTSSFMSEEIETTSGISNFESITSTSVESAGIKTSDEATETSESSTEAEELRTNQRELTLQDATEKSTRKIMFLDKITVKTNETGEDEISTSKKKITQEDTGTEWTEEVTTNIGSTTENVTTQVFTIEQLKKEELTVEQFTTEEIIVTKYHTGKTMLEIEETVGIASEATASTARSDNSHKSTSPFVEETFVTPVEEMPETTIEPTKISSQSIPSVTEETEISTSPESSPFSEATLIIMQTEIEGSTDGSTIYTVPTHTEATESREHDNRQTSEAMTGSTDRKKVEKEEEVYEVETEVYTDADEQDESYYEYEEETEEPSTKDWFEYDDGETKPWEVPMKEEELHEGFVASKEQEMVTESIGRLTISEMESSSSAGATETVISTLSTPISESPALTESSTVSTSFSNFTKETTGLEEESSYFEHYFTTAEEEEEDESTHRTTDFVSRSTEEYIVTTTSLSSLEEETTSFYEQKSQSFETATEFDMLVTLPKFLERPEEATNADVFETSILIESSVGTTEEISTDIFSLKSDTKIKTLPTAVTQFATGFTKISTEIPDFTTGGSKDTIGFKEDTQAIAIIAETGHKTTGAVEETKFGVGEEIIDDKLPEVTIGTSETIGMYRPTFGLQLTNLTESTSIALKTFAISDTISSLIEEMAETAEFTADQYKTTSERTLSEPEETQIEVLESTPSESALSMTSESTVISASSIIEDMSNEGTSEIATDSEHTSKGKAEVEIGTTSVEEESYLINTRVEDKEATQTGEFTLSEGPSSPDVTRTTLETISNIASIFNKGTTETAIITSSINEAISKITFSGLTETLAKVLDLGSPESVFSTSTTEPTDVSYNLINEVMRTQESDEPSSVGEKTTKSKEEVANGSLLMKEELDRISDLVEANQTTETEINEFTSPKVPVSQNTIVDVEAYEKELHEKEEQQKEIHKNMERRMKELEKKERELMDREADLEKKRLKWKEEKEQREEEWRHVEKEQRKTTTTKTELPSIVETTAEEKTFKEEIMATVELITSIDDGKLQKLEETRRTLVDLENELKNRESELRDKEKVLQEKEDELTSREQEYEKERKEFRKQWQQHRKLDTEQKEIERKEKEGILEIEEDIFEEEKTMSGFTQTTLMTEETKVLSTMTNKMTTNKEKAVLTPENTTLPPKNSIFTIAPIEYSTVKITTMKPVVEPIEATPAPPVEETTLTSMSTTTKSTTKKTQDRITTNRTTKKIKEDKVTSERKKPDYKITPKTTTIPTAVRDEKEETSVDEDEKESEDEESRDYVFDEDEEVWKEKHSDDYDREVDKMASEEGCDQESQIMKTNIVNTTPIIFTEDDSDHELGKKPMTKPKQDEEGDRNDNELEGATKKVCLHVLQNDTALSVPRKQSQDFVTEIVCLPFNPEETRAGHGRVARKLMNHKDESSSYGSTFVVDDALKRRYDSRNYKKKKINSLNLYGHEWHNDGTTPGIHTFKGFTRVYESWSEIPKHIVTFRVEDDKDVPDVLATQDELLRNQWKVNKSEGHVRATQIGRLHNFEWSEGTTEHITIDRFSDSSSYGYTDAKKGNEDILDGAETELMDRKNDRKPKNADKRNSTDVSNREEIPQDYHENCRFELQASNRTDLDSDETFEEEDDEDEGNEGHIFVDTEENSREDDYMDQNVSDDKSVEEKEVEEGTGKEEGQDDETDYGEIEYVIDEDIDAENPEIGEYYETDEEGHSEEESQDANEERWEDYGEEKSQRMENIGNALANSGKMLQHKENELLKKKAVFPMKKNLEMAEQRLKKRDETVQNILQKNSLTATRTLRRRKIFESKTLDSWPTESSGRYYIGGHEGWVTVDEDDEDLFRKNKQAFTVNVLRLQYDEEEENHQMKCVPPSPEEIVVKLGLVTKPGTDYKISDGDTEEGVIEYENSEGRLDLAKNEDLAPTMAPGNAEELHPPSSSWPTERTTKYHVGGTLTWDKELLLNPNEVQEVREAISEKEPAEDDYLDDNDPYYNDADIFMDRERRESVQRTTCYTVVLKSGHAASRRNLENYMKKFGKSEEQIEKPLDNRVDEGQNGRTIELKKELKGRKEKSTKTLRRDVIGRRLNFITIPEEKIKLSESTEGLNGPFKNIMEGLNLKPKVNSIKSIEHPRAEKLGIKDFKSPRLYHKADSNMKKRKFEIAADQKVDLNHQRHPENYNLPSYSDEIFTNQMETGKLTFDGLSLDKIVSHVADEILNSVHIRKDESPTLDFRISVKVIPEVANGTELPHEETRREILLDMSGNPISNNPQAQHTKNNNNRKKKVIALKKAKKVDRLVSRSSKRRMNLADVPRKNKRRNWLNKIKREEDENHCLKAIRHRLMLELRRKLKKRGIGRLRQKSRRRRSLFRPRDKFSGKSGTRVGFKNSSMHNFSDLDEKIRIIYAMRHNKDDKKVPRNLVTRNNNTEKKNHYWRSILLLRAAERHKNPHKKTSKKRKYVNRNKRENNLSHSDHYNATKKIVGRNVYATNIRNSNELSGENIIDQSKISPTHISGEISSGAIKSCISASKSAKLDIGEAKTILPTKKTSKNKSSMFYNHMLELQKKLLDKSYCGFANTSVSIKDRNARSSRSTCTKSCNLCSQKYERVKNLVHAGTHYLLRGFDDYEGCKSNSCSVDVSSSRQSLVRHSRESKVKREDSSEVKNMTEKILHFASKIDADRDKNESVRENYGENLDGLITKFGIDELGLTSEDDRKSLAMLVNKIVNVQKNVNKTLQIIRRRLGKASTISKSEKIRKKKVAKMKNVKTTESHDDKKSHKKRKPENKNITKRDENTSKKEKKLTNPKNDKKGSLNTNKVKKRKIDKKNLSPNTKDLGSGLKKVDEEIREIRTENGKTLKSIESALQDQNVCTKSSTKTRSTDEFRKNRNFHPRYPKDMEDTNIVSSGKYRGRKIRSSLWNRPEDIVDISREFKNFRNFLDLTDVSFNFKKRSASRSSSNSTTTSISALLISPIVANSTKRTPRAKTSRKKSTVSKVLERKQYARKEKNVQKSCRRTHEKVESKVEDMAANLKNKKKHMRAKSPKVMGSSEERRAKLKLPGRLKLIGVSRKSNELPKKHMSHYSIRRKLQSNHEWKSQKKLKDKNCTPNGKAGKWKNHSGGKNPKISRKMSKSLKRGNRRSSQTVVSTEDDNIRVKHVYRDKHSGLSDLHNRKSLKGEPRIREGSEVGRSREIENAVSPKMLNVGSTNITNCQSCICDIEEVVEEMKRILTLKADSLVKIVYYECTKFENIGDEIVLVSTGIIGDILPRSRRDLAEAKGMKYVKPGDLEDALKDEVNEERNENNVMSFPGSDLNVPCHRDGDDITWLTSISKPNYTWVREDGLPVSGMVTKNGNLELYEIDVKDTGNYTCFVNYLDPDTEELVQNVYAHRIQGTLLCDVM